MFSMNFLHLLGRNSSDLQGYQILDMNLCFEEVLVKHSLFSVSFGKFSLNLKLIYFLVQNPTKSINPPIKLAYPMYN